jgi:nucleotide-binding universal stress UspA family protein
MLTIKHILFPVDFSDRCEGAVPFVDKMARKFGAKITLMSICPPIWYNALPDGGVPIVIDEAELRDDLETRLNAALPGQFSGLQVQRIARVGDPADSIIEYAHTEGVDLIMMPTHGYGPFRRLLLGSVTAKVLHDAQCPVWTGAHMEGPPALEHLGGRTVLCAVDTTPKSSPLLEWAQDYAKETGASLRLLHVVSGVESWPERALDREFEEALRQQAREAIEKLQRSVGVDAPLCIGTGDIASGVKEEAERHAADLIVIGRGLLHETLGRLRTHAHSIIRHAPCPVISV